jgi:hexosaminidase
MTLSQLGRFDAKTKEWTYPCVEVADAPKFKWRGVLLDTARHFLGKTTIKRIINEMSWYKFNVLQIHFTDDEGWTLEIPEYPELAKHDVKGGRTGQVLGERVPPLLYSANDIREIVEYARARHVKVVPEIEMPRHFGAALRAYPQFRCDSPDRANNRSVMCIGNPECIRFAEKVLDRVCEMFPSDVIHIAGDECPRNFWRRCPRCQAHIKREGLKGVEELQPWLTRHLVTYLEKKGRSAIGWDEIFLNSTWEKWGDFLKAGGDSFNSLLPKTTMGMCWRPWGAGALAANRGYRIVRCPISHCYFDYGQCLPEDPYPYGGRVPLGAVYSFDPLEGVDAKALDNVIGGQCCNWAERTIGLYDLEWKLWPRGLALSEVLWTYPDPKKRNFAEFSERAAEHRRRLIRRHVNCAPLK